MADPRRKLSRQKACHICHDVTPTFNKFTETSTIAALVKCYIVLQKALKSSARLYSQPCRQFVKQTAVHISRSTAGLYVAEEL